MNAATASAIDAKGIETVRCNLCGSGDARPLYSLPVLPHQAGKYNRDVWPVVQCRRCGLIYENPRPDAAALEVFYDFEHPIDMQFVESWFVENQDFNRANWQAILRAMRRFAPPGRLLDVGCGSGGFLVEARRAGYDVAGQDIAPFFVQYCRQQQGLDVYSGYLEKLRLPSSSFDCVTAFDVIEHHPDPKGLLQEMRRLVKPGGLIVVGTHDIGNFYARLYGPRWRHLYAIGHLTYFTRDTLTAMMESCDLLVLHRAGAHTIGGSRLEEARNHVAKFLRVILLRAAVIGLYKPAAARLPALTRWRLRLGEAELTHDKLLMRAGSQLIMNDNMVLLARRAPEREAA